MTNKFNSKYAAGMEDFFNTGGLEEEILDPSSGMSVYTPPERREEEEPSGFEPSQEQLANEVYNNFGLNIFPEPVRSLSPKPVPRTEIPSLTNPEGLHFTKMLLPDSETGKLTESWEPEERVVNPKEWAESIKDTAAKKRTERIDNPELAEFKQQKSDYEAQNLQNRRVIAATYRLVPEVLKNAGYGCQACEATGKNQRTGKICNSCEGHCFDDKAASALTDIEAGAARRNYALDYHTRVCDGEVCDEDCLLRGMVDRFIRQPFRKSSNDIIPLEAVRAKPGRDTFVDRKLRYTAVDDKFQPIAPLFLRMGSKGSADPLKPGTVCHYLNWDTVDPTREATGEVSDRNFPTKSGIYDPSGNTRDQQAFAVITRANGNGTFDGIISARSREALRQFKINQRRTTRPGRRDTIIDRASDVFTTKVLDPALSRAHTHLSNMFNRIVPFSSKRSELSGKDEGRYYVAAKNLSADQLAPLNNISAAFACHSGETTKSSDGFSLPQGSWYDAPRGKGVRGDRTTPPKITTANMIHRVGHGFSMQELAQAHNYITDGETLKELNRLRHGMLKGAGIVPENYSDPEEYRAHLERYDFAPQLGEPPRLTSPAVEDEETPDVSQYGQPLTTKAPKELKTPTTTFNSGNRPLEPSLDDEEDMSNVTFPMEEGPETPPHINEIEKPSQKPQESVDAIDALMQNNDFNDLF